MWVLSVMYQQSGNLRRLDQTLVTKREFDNVLVWSERLFPKKMGKLKKLLPENGTVKTPPPLKVEEDDKKPAQGATAGGQ